MNAHELITLLAIVPEFRSGLLTILCATDASMITKLLDIELTIMEKKVYLNPIRDIPGLSMVVRAAIEVGYTPALMGTDVSLLSMRIENPIAFKQIYEDPKPLTMMLVIWDNDRRTAGSDDKVAEAISNMISICYTCTTADVLHSVIVSDYAYQTRLIVINRIGIVHYTLDIDMARIGAAFELNDTITTTLRPFWMLGKVDCEAWSIISCSADLSTIATSLMDLSTDAPVATTSLSAKAPIDIHGTTTAMRSACRYDELIINEKNHTVMIYVASVTGPSLCISFSMV